uniref:Uncharacterized protein n=1 Tax=Ombrophytum subterraneum TaxID=50155 RepID=A0A6M8PH42_9MAGN|nr:hypothetical protein [Ombrophytum subterraneum]
MKAVKQATKSTIRLHFLKSAKKSPCAQTHPQRTKRIQLSFKELIREQPILKATYLNLKTASFRDDYSAAVIANRKGAPLTQALVPSKHPTASADRLAPFIFGARALDQ